MATNEEILAELSAMKESLNELKIEQARREGFEEGQRSVSEKVERARREGFDAGRHSVFETVKQFAQIAGWLGVGIGALWGVFGWLYPISKVLGE